MKRLIAITMLISVACGGVEPKCETGVFECDGNVLMECIDESLQAIEDCEEKGELCLEGPGSPLTSRAMCF